MSALELATWLASRDWRRVGEGTNDYGVVKASPFDPPEIRYALHGLSSRQLVEMTTERDWFGNNPGAKHSNFGTLPQFLNATYDDDVITYHRWTWEYHNGVRHPSTRNQRLSRRRRVVAPGTVDHTPYSAARQARNAQRRRDRMAVDPEFAARVKARQREAGRLRTVRRRWLREHPVAGPVPGASTTEESPG